MKRKSLIVLFVVAMSIMALSSSMFNVLVSKADTTETSVQMFGKTFITRNGTIVGEYAGVHTPLYYSYPTTGTPNEAIVVNGKVIGVYDFGGAAVIFGNPAQSDPLKAPPFDDEESEREKEYIDRLDQATPLPQNKGTTYQDAFPMTSADDAVINGRRVDTENSPYAPYSGDPTCYVRRTLGDKYPGSPNYLLTYGVGSVYDNSSRPTPPGHTQTDGCAVPYEWAIVDWYYLCRFNAPDKGAAHDCYRTDTGPNQVPYNVRIIDVSQQAFSNLGLFYCRTWVQVNYYNN
jgi:hypothetical protein